MASWYQISLTHAQIDAWGQYRIVEAFSRYRLLSADASNMALFAAPTPQEGLTLYFTPACYPHCRDFIYLHARYSVSPYEKPTEPVVLLAGEQDAWANST
jgi:hypothetical protein